MSASASAPATPARRDPELLGQTVVVIGGSAGIGFETARRARAEGARIILTGRNRERLEQAARELGAERTAAFDANDPDTLQSFFQDVPSPIDHVMVTAGAPHYGPALEMSPEDARQGLTEHLLLALNVARSAAGKVRPACPDACDTTTALEPKQLVTITGVHFDPSDHTVQRRAI